MLIRGVEMTFFGFGTEAQEKVKQAARNILPSMLFDLQIEFQDLSGYFGDPLRYYIIRINQRKNAKLVFDHIIRKLSSYDLTILLSELEKRMDKTRNLYLRFDKQKAYQKKIVFNNHDSIRVKVKFHFEHKADPIETISNYIRELIA
jgi:RNA binding exosome subunit